MGKEHLMPEDIRVRPGSNLVEIPAEATSSLGLGANEMRGLYPLSLTYVGVRAEDDKETLLCILHKSRHIRRDVLLLLFHPDFCDIKNLYKMDGNLRGRLVSLMYHNSPPLDIDPQESGAIRFRLPPKFFRLIDLPPKRVSSITHVMRNDIGLALVAGLFPKNGTRESFVKRLVTIPDNISMPA